MNDTQDELNLVNPGRHLLPEIEVRLNLAKKVKPIWARQVEAEQEIESLEGVHQLRTGDYLC